MRDADPFQQFMPANKNLLQPEMGQRNGWPVKSEFDDSDFFRIYVFMDEKMVASSTARRIKNIIKILHWICLLVAGYSSIQVDMAPIVAKTCGLHEWKQWRKWIKKLLLKTLFFSISKWRVYGPKK